LLDLLLQLVTRGGNKKIDITDPNYLNGKTILITGGSMGIGYETVKQLLAFGPQRIIIASRNENAANEAIKTLNNYGNSSTTLEYMHLDLLSFDSVRKIAKTIDDRNIPIHILINNASALLDPTVDKEENLEAMFKANHLSHFLLANLLLENLVKNNARVISLSSELHSWWKGPPLFEEVRTNPSKVGHQGYDHSKLCNVLFARGLQQKFEKENTKAISVALTPGLVNTNLGMDLKFSLMNVFTQYVLKPFFSKSPEEGAKTTVFCAVDNIKPGAYYENCRETTPSKAALDQENVDKLWQASEKYTHLK
jgi:WW domain-containing oxidoreductase